MNLSTHDKRMVITICALPSACKHFWNAIFDPYKNNTSEIIFHVVLLLGSLARQIDVQGEGLTQH